MANYKEVEKDVSCPEALGQLLTLTLDVENRMPGDLVPDEWFCRKVEVTTTEGEKQRFPVSRWLTIYKPRVFREATAHLVFQDHRSKTLDTEGRRVECVHGSPCLPHIVDADSAYGLPAEVRFSFSKETEFAYTIAAALVALGITNSVQQPRASFDAIGALFTKRKTEMYKYVEKHWREDEFFGYQFLNGHNPMMICACSALPDHFPISDQMVQASIQPGSSHWKLKQKPGDLNPIFLPSDSQYDWLLAKNFVGSAEFAEHELKYHLPHTHLLCEVFAMATLHHFPMVYVQGVVTFYYTSDAYVTRDSELQNWILDIFTHGFHANSGSGIPRSFSNVPELVKFITMVVFTASAQHAAVNNGQVVLGAEAPDQYEEAMPRDQAKRFQDDLKALKEDIHLRNSLLPVPYTHLDPEHIENSVAI
ncbi:polyunsaturated fatty acid lipoxygenase ALOX15B-like [Aplochiton taeniatus]